MDQKISLYEFLSFAKALLNNTTLYRLNMSAPPNNPSNHNNLFVPQDNATPPSNQRPAPARQGRSRAPVRGRGIPLVNIPPIEAPNASNFQLPGVGRPPENTLAIQTA